MPKFNMTKQDFINEIVETLKEKRFQFPEGEFFYITKLDNLNKESLNDLSNTLRYLPSDFNRVARIYKVLKPLKMEVKYTPRPNLARALTKYVQQANKKSFQNKL
jgi:hypothetical protein